MKNLLLTFVTLFSTFVVFSQENDIRKIEKKGDLLEVKLYYENGNIMQHGFYTEDGKLHATWESFNLDGSRKCIATYNYGVKVGTWTYWSENKITKIVYDNNNIISIEETELTEKIKNTF
ncbi:toxin-antitoxin system YwqK family antitoxin [Lutibacter sp. B1]|uniref:toxin-antitoxin system YwqK family antitoxin n=1 Tax=Lutibacter sp. B1 TaxID=2725996 RepID=UPI0014570D94|nr:nicotinic acid mononucleotide adenyltransferase [Lutibacter sp. B1]NLP57697.1 nicotinic acid mononucleotide adenyltransferase [Lutibacter sp. B1]